MSMNVSALSVESRWSAEGLALKTQDFLRLLVAELQHQDPLKPLEEADFISQAAQFAQLDEIRRGCTLLERMADDSFDLIGASQVIGLRARAETQAGTVEGEVTGVVARDGGLLIEVSGQKVPVGALSRIWKA
jgi:flagellar basal-body rod modification protein FlgD